MLYLTFDFWLRTYHKSCSKVDFLKQIRRNVGHGSDGFAYECAKYFYFNVRSKDLNRTLFYINFWCAFLSYAVQNHQLWANLNPVFLGRWVSLETSVWTFFQSFNICYELVRHTSLIDNTRLKQRVEIELKPDLNLNHYFKPKIRFL